MNKLIVRNKMQRDKADWTGLDGDDRCSSICKELIQYISEYLRELQIQIYFPMRFLSLQVFRKNLLRDDL